MKQKILNTLKPILAVLVGLGAGLLVSYAAGESPLHVMKILFHAAFGSLYDFGMTLFYTTPLVFTGLAVAIPLQAGLFNIGAEGQLTIGAFSAAMAGILFPGMGHWSAVLLGSFAAFLGGAVWGAIPGYLRAKRGSHEVINTIMLNFVAAAATSYGTLYIFKGTATQNPETLPVGPGYMLSRWAVFGDAPVTSALLLAVAMSVATYFFLNSTVPGYRIKALGRSEEAARAAGISAVKSRILGMALGGGMAGLVGVAEIFGNSGKFKLEFSPGYGFTGIAVALLARGNALGILVSAFLFAALHKGSADLDLETENVTRDISAILQAFVILSVGAEGLWNWRRTRKPASSKISTGVRA